MASLKSQKPAGTQSPAPAIKEPPTAPKTCRTCTTPATGTPAPTPAPAPTTKSTPSKPTPGKKGAGAK